MNILNGGKVTDLVGSVGSGTGSSGSAATVSGTGSTWTHTGDLLIGDPGTGTLAILNGGVVSNDFGTVGRARGVPAAR